MFLKAIAKRWADAKLQAETAHTQALISRLEAEQAAVSRRIEEKKADYQRQLEAHQAMRNRQLQQYLDFMNSQLTITGNYLPQLEDFQAFTFNCIDSWMQLDLNQQALSLVKEKLQAVRATTLLIDAWIDALSKQTQEQERQAWRALASTQELSVASDFISKTQAAIDRSTKQRSQTFRSELQRLKSHRAQLQKEAGTLHEQKRMRVESQAAALTQHRANQKTLQEKYQQCVAHWSEIADRFSAYYAFTPADQPYADRWLAMLKAGGTLPELTKVIGTAHEIIKCADEVFRDLNDRYQPVKQRVQAAYDAKSFPASFDSDKAEKKRLAPQVSAAFQDKKALREGRALLQTRRDELKTYLAHIQPLHPDAAIESICEKLSAEGEFNSRHVFGSITTKQRRDRREKPRSDHAAAN